jgi:vacuolar-type H+-ATPase catalytic subunit A/Vma1
MDIAITIFRVGVGVGAVLVGLGIILIAFSLRPLARDARALANDARRLANLAERELAGLIDGARELTQDTEAVTRELEQRVARLDRQTERAEDGGSAAHAVSAAVASPVSPRTLPPVQSRDAREDERIA